MCTDSASAPVEQESVRPGINERWTRPTLEIAEAQGILEAESREIYASRHELQAALRLEAGGAAADVGAGTGFMAWLMASAVGRTGQVYAVELSRPLHEHLLVTARERGLKHVRAVLCTERSAELPPASVETILLCDTYHHFEYPQASLSSLRSALRPGGQLVVVDFEKIPGISREFVFGHVRLDKQETREEIEGAGFVFDAELEVEGLEENYCLRFLRP